MLFPPMKKDEIEKELEPKFYLFPNGLYNFIVSNVIEETSKSRNPQLKLTLSISDGVHVGKVWDYIFYSESAKWKLITFAKAIGVEEALEAGALEPYMIKDKSGVCRLIQEEYEGKIKNKVKAYIHDEAEKAHLALVKAEELQPDLDIPF